jgi:hypothetical protein
VTPSTPVFRDRAISDDSDSTRASVVVNRPPATQPDDVIVAVVYTDDPAPVAIPDGWHQIDNSGLPCSAGGWTTWAYIRATPADPESWDFPRRTDAGVVDLESIAVAYGGVLGTGPSDQGVAGGTQAPITDPSLLIDTPNTLVLAAFTLRVNPTAWAISQEW